MREMEGTRRIGQQSKQETLSCRRRLPNESVAADPFIFLVARRAPFLLPATKT
jgi:hypothetical protein